MTRRRSVVRVVGVDKLTATMLKAAGKLQVMDVARVTADEGQTSARRRAPVRTGHLRGSVSSSGAPTRAQLVAAARYAEYVNYGTKYMRARRFFSMAYRDMRLYADDTITTAVDEVLADVKGA